MVGSPRNQLNEQLKQGVNIPASNEYIDTVQDYMKISGENFLQGISKRASVETNQMYGNHMRLTNDMLSIGTGSRGILKVAGGHQSHHQSKIKVQGNITGSQYFNPV